MYNIKIVKFGVLCSKYFVPEFLDFHRIKIFPFDCVKCCSHHTVLGLIMLHFDKPQYLPE